MTETRPAKVRIPDVTGRDRSKFIEDVKEMYGDKFSLQGDTLTVQVPTATSTADIVVAVTRSLRLIGVQGDAVAVT